MSEVAPARVNVSGASPGDGLLATKLYARQARGHLVARARLIERLDEGLGAGLILVSAPAGFGKTTLLVEWLTDRPHRSCWLSLDAADNDPARFLSYVIAALQTAAPGVAGDLVAPLRSLQPPTAEVVVTTLVNELAAEDAPLILVLDDYHAITSAAINGAVAFLLENLPPSLHLVIATRSDPAIPIARLRSRGHVVEVRADDLRFTPDEAAAFLGESMGLALSPEQVAALDARAEGWIAGLQMAALSMRGREDVDGFIQAFAGTHRFIMDFMLEEVLARESEEVQAFLLQTAVLTRLCGPLCDAVTGASGGQEMLERLERRNLFVVPLDDERRWYRYHHLFSDLLQARLFQAGPDAVARLLLSASAWCEREGQVADAVSYALAAKDYRRAADLIAEHCHRTMGNGEIETVWGWLEALPEEVVRDSAPLGVAYCWVLWLKGRVGEIEAHLVDAERAVSALAAPEGLRAGEEDYAALRAQILALRSFVARYHNDYETAIARAEQALRLVPEGLPPQESAQLRSLAYLTLASAYDGFGDIEKAVGAYAETIRLSRLGASATGVAGITYRMAGALRVLGRLRAADEACQRAWEYVQEQGMARLPATGILHVAMGEVLLERNALEAAEAHLLQGMEQGKGSGRLDAVTNAASSLARLRLARGDADAALAAVRDAEATLGERPAALARAEMLALRAKILLRQGRTDDAAQCVQEAARLAGGDRGQTGEIVTLARLRVLLAQDAPEALAELTRSLDAAEAAGRLGTAIEIRVLRSLALARRGDARAAEADLRRALVLAEPEGYVRVLVDEGAAMAALVRRIASGRSRTREADGCSAEYFQMLLAAFDAAGEGSPAAVASRSPEATSRAGIDGLVEPLTPREMEVLHLICAGQSNREIADALVVTVSAVKKHTGNILGKLGVTSRAQAMVRARQLGLHSED